MTICTQKRAYLFGNIIDGSIRLNEADEMVQTMWNEIPGHYIGIDVDEFVIMLNHIHGSIVIVGGCPYKAIPA